MKDRVAVASRSAAGFESPASALRLALRLDFAWNDGLIINAFELPAVGALLAATEGAALEFQIPLGALPRFFLPPIAGCKIRPALICDFAVDLRAAKMRRLVCIE